MANQACTACFPRVNRKLWWESLIRNLESTTGVLPRKYARYGKVGCTQLAVEHDAHMGRGARHGLCDLAELLYRPYRLLVPSPGAVARKLDSPIAVYKQHSCLAQCGRGGITTHAIALQHSNSHCAPRVS